MTVVYGMIMRQYILTNREREEIQKYLKDKKVTDLISVLRVRAKKYLERLKEDIHLLEQVRARSIKYNKNRGYAEVKK